MSDLNKLAGKGTAALRYLTKDPVLLISLIAAIVSAFFVPPSAAYFSYIDWRVLALLLALMLVIAGLKEAGIFLVLVDTMLKKLDNTRTLSMALVAVCFFSSMLITNDVALITFVPLTVLLLTRANQTGLMIFIIVLETISANLGSMLTPLGNPQNLYLYSLSGVSVAQFLRVMCVPTACAFVLLGCACFFVKSVPLSKQFPTLTKKPELKTVLPWLLLFCVCLLSVVHILHVAVALVIVVLGVLAFDRRLLRTADYGLLLTFTFFFIFIGNMKNIPVIRNMLSTLIVGRELIGGILLSQVISNVPAAMLLSGFTENYGELLLGVNLGGLGTPIASMASLISYKAYAATEDANTGRYMGVFMALNILFLLLLLGITMLLLPQILV